MKILHRRPRRHPLWRHHHGQGQERPGPPPEGLEIARALGGRVAEIAKKLKG
jgi:hypothetical protein